LASNPNRALAVHSVFSRMQISLAFVAALLASAAACGDSAAPTATDTNAVPGARYIIRDLTPTIGDSSTVMRLNNNGQILGVAGTSLDPAKRPFIWSDGAVRFVNGCDFPQDLNNAGAVLCLIPPRASKVVIWRDGVVTPFAPFDTVPVGAWVRFNDSAFVVGGLVSASICGPPMDCAVVGGRATLTVLERGLRLDRGEGIETIVTINTRGDVLTTGYNAAFFYYQPVFVFDASGDSVQRFAPGRSSAVADMNDSDHVVGRAADSSQPEFAWFWHAGVMDTIGPGAAASINNSDIVVGTVGEVYAGGSHGFRWHKGSAPVALDSLIDDHNWTIESASLINDAGQIVATGSNTSLGLKHHVVLLDPKPSNP
jgi:hypothetical protein